MPVNQVSNIHGYGRFWYHPKGIANILGLSNVSDNYKYWVQYESQDIKDSIFPCTKYSKETSFCRAPHGLHWIDTKATKTGDDRVVPINTVEDNKCSYTRRSYLRAKLARKIQRIIGQPSVKTLKQIIGSNLITNYPVNIEDVSAAEKIFVPDKGKLNGKTVRTKPQDVMSIHINLPMELIAKYQSVILSADYMFVNGVPFFNTYISDIKFVT